MKRKLLFFIAVVVGIMIVVAPLSSAVAADPKINVMTRNLYLGADIFKVVEAAENNPDSIPLVVAEVFQTMLYTNFWARAEAIADEIADAKPQVIGLQEVSAFYIQTPGDFMVYDPELDKLVPDPEQTPAENLVIDFYAVLNSALEARGMYYDAFPVTNADVELPMFDLSAGGPFYLSDVRMVDHDYVLVRKGIAASEVLSDNYGTNLGLYLGDVYVEFTRGFVVVDVNVKGEDYRFVSTHLEVRSDPESVFRVVQSAQMQELLGTIDYIAGLLGPKPVILVGDLNSSSDDVPGYGLHPVYGWLPYVPPYMQATDPDYGGIFDDTWLLQSKYDDGFTSGFDEYVSDPYDPLTTRIDHIFLNREYLTVDKVKSEVVGDDPSEMVLNNNDPDPNALLWPSDHAGVVGKIKFLE
jgi:endonuclease/exonuclease/phosphatase family metal-dependent hydrolase